jgi:hypothetical protein
MGGIVSGIGQQVANVVNSIPQQPVQTKPIIDPRNPNMSGRDGRNIGRNPSRIYPMPPTPVYQPFEGSGGYFNPTNQATINQDIQNAQNGVFYGPGAQGGGVFGDPIPQPSVFPMSSTPMPANYTGPATQPQMPQYGQQPQRGPVQRNLQPAVTQGLGGLMNRR